MVSRAWLVAVLVLAAVAVAAGATRSQPGASAAIYVVRVDPRLCPSPLCGGYWVSLANGARTRCADGKPSSRCYVAKAIGGKGLHEVAIGDGALARAKIRTHDYAGLGRLGILEVTAVFEPAGTAQLSGGYYRVVDTGIRCVRAPCFTYRATQVNGSTRTVTSGVDLAAAGAAPAEVARARAALRTKNGLLARGRFAAGTDGGRMFRALRVYLRAPQPHA
jgi:Domain of unknown function (DUF6748)